MTSWQPGADGPEDIVRLTHAERCAILLADAPPAGTNIVLADAILVIMDDPHLTDSGLLELNVAIIAEVGDVTPAGLNPLQFYNPPTETYDADGNLIPDALATWSQMLIDAVVGRF